MKKNSIHLRIIFGLTLFGVALQSSAPLYAFNTQESIKTLKQETIKKLNENYSKLRKAVKCALTKEGCTDEQAFKIRATIGAILAVIGVAVVGTAVAGTLLYFGRSKKKEEEVTTKKGEAELTEEEKNLTLLLEASKQKKEVTTEEEVPLVKTVNLATLTVKDVIAILPTGSMTAKIFEYISTTWNESDLQDIGKAMKKWGAKLQMPEDQDAGVKFWKQYDPQLGMNEK